ncbi:peptidoglycan-binding protein (plasmid) [Embleya sp. NBC_00888]|uniref:peptidoglycan-binding protein n=1 Tax=Embleya sp. NBC_00888 TaxID=2975960 RepID=UPI002F9160F5|nr:peptidoglycan-binding protein [Embleya sp. NBC_00888]
MASADDEGAGTVEFAEPARARRGRRVVLIAVVVLALGGGAAFAVASRDGGADGPAKASTGVSTATVERIDLSDARDLPGTLGFGTEQPLKAGRKGIVTWLPKSGDTITRGKSLYRLDDRPVSLFYGATPMFRALGRTEGDAAGGGTAGKADPKQADPKESDTGQSDAKQSDPQQSDAKRTDAKQADPKQADPKQDTGKKDVAKPPQGRDVRMVADNLKALGYDIGTQPGGTATGEATWTPALSAAVKKWQKALGVPQTGALEVGDVAVLSGEIRVGALSAALGDDASTAPVMMTVTPTAKAVSVSVAAADIGSIAVDTPVTVVLPDNTEVRGTVSGVGRSAEHKDAGTGGPGSDAGGAKMTVTVTLDEAGAVGNLDAAGVQVRFVTETRRGVLAVPIGALVALREGGYAVQLPAGRLIAVKTGLFVKGMVEVEGGGLEPGLRVVTTS